MRPHRMDIAPGLLNRVVEEDRPAPAGLEQAIDDVHTPGYRLGGLPPVTRSVWERNFLSCASELHHVREAAQDSVAHRVHFGDGFSEAESYERVLSDPCTILGDRLQRWYREIG
jgi:hypothetical protein